MALRSAASRDAQPACPCLCISGLEPAALPAPSAEDGGRPAAGVTSLAVHRPLGFPSLVSSSIGQRQSWTPDACNWARVFTLPGRHQKPSLELRIKDRKGI